MSRAPASLAVAGRSVRPFGYAIHTLGCRVNLADSLALEAELEALGGRACAPELADVAIVNSCSVTAGAERATRQAVGRARRENAACPVLVIGCYASRAACDLRRLPGVVDAIGHEHPREVAARAAAVAAANAPEPPTTGAAGRTVFTLCVQTGCNEVCAFCIVPHTRGPARSRRPVDVLTAVRRVVDQGYREVVITGVHLGVYGHDLAPPSSLADLLEAVAAAAPDVRVRLGSIEPSTCSTRLIDLAAAGTIAPHFHLPLQHASPALLAAMRRPYRIGDYARVIDGIRQRMPDAAIGADVLVGFPGESEGDTDALCRFLEGSPLTYLHVFPYSDRPGTAASVMPAKVPPAAVRSRVDRVRRIGQQLQRRFHERQEGSEHDALTLDDGTVALTGHYLKVHIAPGLPRNTWVRVRVTGTGDLVTGEVIGPSYGPTRKAGVAGRRQPAVMPTAAG